MFRKAQRKKAKLRLGIAGASGSGKTLSALEIAFGITTGEKIFFIDTESGEGEMYQGVKSEYQDVIFDYNYLRIDSPFSPEKYIESIKGAEKEGCEVLIIDSLSHAWSGEGGILSIVDKAGGQFQNGWKVATPKQNLLIDTIKHSNMHVICNLRVKTEYVIEINEKGKNAPRKIGLAPIQRDQLEYEFTVYMTMNQDHIAHVSKDRTGMFDQEYITPSPEMGKKLITWLESGIDELDYFKENTLPQILIDIGKTQNENELRNIFNMCKEKYYEKFKEEFSSIVKAKDERKNLFDNFSEPSNELDLTHVREINKLPKQVNGVN